MKKFITLCLAVALSVSFMTACSSQGDGNKEKSSEVTAVKSEESQQEKFAILYPSYMQEKEGEELVLEQKPEKIISLSNSALQILIKCGIKPIAVTKPHKTIDYPDWVKELPVISTGMDSLDTEMVISMMPDLVIMGSHLKEDFGQQLKDAGIPVYYTSEGPSITYQEVKEEAITLTKSFGTPEQVKQVEDDFKQVEERAAEYKKSVPSKKMMILFGAPPAYQQTSKGYLGSILSMLPFENLTDKTIDPDNRTAPLDLESLVNINPEVLFAISPTAPTADTIKQVYLEEFEKNPKIWDNLQAVKNNRLIWLSNEYVTSKGIHIIDSINSLIDMLEETFDE